MAKRETSEAEETPAGTDEDVSACAIHRGVNNLVIRQDMQVRVSGHQQVRAGIAQVPRPLCELAPDRLQLVRDANQRGAGVGQPSARLGIQFELWMKLSRLVRIVEERPIPGIEVTFGRCILGEQDTVLFELDMIVREWRVISLGHDRTAVDEHFRGDAMTVNNKTMFRRKKKIGHRLILGDCVLAKANGRSIFSVSVPGEVNYGKAHPLHWLKNLVTTTQHNDLCARGNRLDSDVAPLSANSGSVHVTCVLPISPSPNIAATAESFHKHDSLAEITTTPKRPRYDRSRQQQTGDKILP
jgi:hypothetical protein